MKVMGLRFVAQTRKNGEEKIASQNEQRGGALSKNVGLKCFVWGEGPSAVAQNLLGFMFSVLRI